MIKLKVKFEEQHLHGSFKIF